MTYIDMTNTFLPLREETCREKHPSKSLQHLLEELITKADLERLKANHDNRSKQRRMTDFNQKLFETL